MAVQNFTIENLKNAIENCENEKWCVVYHDSYKCNSDSFAFKTSEYEAIKASFPQFFAEGGERPNYAFEIVEDDIEDWNNTHNLAQKEQYSLRKEMIEKWILHPAYDHRATRRSKPELFAELDRIDAHNNQLRALYELRIKAAEDRMYQYSKYISTYILTLE